MHDPLSSEKQLLRSFHDLLLSGAHRAADRLHGECEWHGPHPLNQINGGDRFLSAFWHPLRDAFDGLERRDDIFLAGKFNGQIWVSATGHYEGRFVRDWLGIPASGRMARLRYGEFARIEGGRIVESRVLFDLPALAAAAGHPLLPSSRGSEAPVPGPMTVDGILLDGHDPEVSRASLKIVEDMIFGLNQYKGATSDEDGQKRMGQARYFSEDLAWYGPHGIGATFGLDQFVERHQKPFLHAFPDRAGGNHRARIAEGRYVASTGWPSVRATHAGDYLGAPATGRSIGMRVMDWWRCDAGKLRENWVLIDLPDLFMQFGIDLLARCAR